jgi:hypothetical protein
MFGAADVGPLTEIETDGPAKSRTEDILRWVWRVGLSILCLLVLGLAWLVATGQLFRAGDDLGYNLGLAGGIMMLTLLLYPLRKRVRFLDRWGEMRYWFRYHMVAGIVGPLLVIFHSTFRIGAMNSRVALYAMLLVAISGIVGRFLYRHIHRGMYGQHLTLSDVQTDLAACTENMDTIFAQYPQIHERLLLFRKYAFLDMPGIWPRLKRFVMLRIIAHRLAKRVRDQLKSAMKRAKREERLTRPQRILNYRLARQKTDAFLDAVCDASQLAGWEKLFSLWHVVHIPFLYLLIGSGVVHVIAVHMY